MIISRHKFLSREASTGEKMKSVGRGAAEKFSVNEVVIWDFEVPRFSFCDDEEEENKLSGGSSYFYLLRGACMSHRTLFIMKIAKVLLIRRKKTKSAGRNFILRK